MPVEFKREFYAEAWHAEQPYDAEEAIRLVRACEVMREHNASLHLDRRYELLDIGCGVGPLRRWLPAEQFRIVGMELSAAAAEVARRHYDTCDIGDVEGEWPFPTDAFDAVHSGAVQEHVMNWHAPFNQANRVLRLSGLLVISTPNLRYWKEIRRLIRGKQPHWIMDMAHVHAYTPAFLKEMFTVHGFEVIHFEADRVNLPFLPKHWGCRRLAGWGSVMIMAGRLVRRVRVEDDFCAPQYPQHRRVMRRAIEILEGQGNGASS